MRIASDNTADLLSAMNSARELEQTALRQLSSGRRAELPSDDPSAIASLTQNVSNSSQVDEFLHSVLTLRSMMQTADSTLNSVVSGLERAVSLGVNGANGSQSQQQREALAGEVRGIRDNLLNLANLSFRGSYLFAGTASGSAPFVADNSAPSGIRYGGNQNTNQTQVAEGRTVDMNIPGSEIFSSAGSDVFQSMNDLIVALEKGTSEDVAQATSSVRAAFDHVTAKRVFYGNSMNQLDATEQFLDREKLDLKTQQSELVGADMTETVSNLLSAQTVLQSTMAATAKISRLSLFDFLQ